MNWKVFFLIFRKDANEGLLDLVDYVLKENRVQRKSIERVKLDDNDRLTLSIAARKLGRKQLEDVCTIFTPETVLGWYRRILAKSHTYPPTLHQLGD